MNPPEFTAQEQYIIHGVKSTTWYNGILFDLAYLAPSLTLIVFGYKNPSISADMLLFVAFGLIACFRVWSWLHDYRYGPCFRSVLEKYEHAFAAEPPTPTSTQPH